MLLVMHSVAIAPDALPSLCLAQAPSKQSDLHSRRLERQPRPKHLENLGQDGGGEAGRMLDHHKVALILVVHVQLLQELMSRLAHLSIQSNCRAWAQPAACAWPANNLSGQATTLFNQAMETGCHQRRVRCQRSAWTHWRGHG